MEAKKALGRDIVAFYYGADAAQEAEAEWRRRVSERKTQPRFRMRLCRVPS